MKGFIGTYKEILYQISLLANNREIQDQRKISDINYLNRVEHRKVVEEWNATDREYPRDRVIHSIFEEQAEKDPDNVAIVYEGISLSYGELNERANKLANYLLSNHKIMPDNMIALCLDRSEQMIISIIGVLKAGAGYVPIDPDYPEERISYILEDTGSNIVISNTSYRAKLLNAINGANKSEVGNKDSKLSILEIDSQALQDELAKQLFSNPITDTRSDNLAYVIYTSGTTGTPKGVMIEHRSVINTIFGLFNVYDFSNGNKVIAFTSYVFDVSVSEFFASLLRGGELHLLSELLRSDVSLIGDYVKDQGINYLYLPPILLSSLPKDYYHNLYGIIYAGEPCDRETGVYWSKNNKLYNYY
ncbi:MAG: hypothetical protein EBX37_18640, partial [Alphaproteobacteria bacterium]|nr:hypothetical protein [Alphaproteobacteria bacterium]